MTQQTNDEISKWQRGALYAIGAWTALGGVSALADPQGHAATFFGGSIEPGGATIAFQIAYAQLLAWGFGYALAARRPAMRAPILTAGALGKTLYFAIAASAFAHGTGTTALLLTGIGDLAIASFFVFLVLRGTARAMRPQARERVQS